MNQPPRIVRRAGVQTSGWPAHVPPLLQRIYSNRGALDIDSAQPRLAALLPPDLLSGMDAAVTLLLDAIRQDKRIVVVGDFDCDGATACAVGVRGLRMLGARQVTAAVPNRLIHGYGLSPGLVQELAALQPQLLVTVDHGIACHAGIAAAKAHGWQVLVTDHHLPGEVLPAADAIVNPNQHGDGFPSKGLAGVGVMFYVLLALRARLRQDGLLEQPAPDLASLLDLVAVGTVADLVPLDVNNRALVSAGLRRLRAGQGSAGLQALIQVSGRQAQQLTASDIGFAVAPRLNAAGRLEDMALGIECLLTDDPTQAMEMAEVLNGINAERRGVQQQMVDEAEAALSMLALQDSAEARLAICLFDPDWHPGVVGLVASKIKEKLHRPVVAFAPSEPGSDSLRGSARSIPGFHIRDALAVVDSRHPGLIDKFGGHAMAAGLSLPLQNRSAFEQAFIAVATQLLQPEQLQQHVLSDGELTAAEMDIAHAQSLRSAGPWGQGFPEPLFDGHFQVLRWQVLKERHLKLSLRHPDCSEPINAIHFGGWSGDAPAPQVHIAYRLVADDYRGGSAIQLIIEHCSNA